MYRRRGALATNRIQHPDDSMAYSDRQAQMASSQHKLDFLLAAAWQGLCYTISEPARW
jgi:aminoglycoside N3'-acetyltransferase